LVQIAQSFVQLALCAQKIGAAKKGWCMARVGFNRAIEIGECLFVAADLTIGERAIGVSGRMVRVEADRLREIGDGFLITPGARLGSTTRVIGFG
jgi:hypothetical protein